MKRKYTVKTQLHIINNREIIEYFEEINSIFCSIYRKVFHVINQGVIGDVSKYNTYLQHKYGIKKRTANTLIRTAQGRYNSIKELKKFELKQLIIKESVLHEALQDLIKGLDLDKSLAAENKLVDLEKYRNLKKKVAFKKMKLNKIRQQMDFLDNQIESGRFKICFGTKKLLKSDYESFVSQRDKTIDYMGSWDETAGNQLLQLTYDKSCNQFNIQLTKDFKYKDASVDEKYARGKCYFNHHKPEIIEILNGRGSPLSYKISKEKGRYYLSCVFEVKFEKDDYVSDIYEGVIGLDFNKGFVSVSETNGYGDLVSVSNNFYRFKQGNATKNDMQKLTYDLVQLAVDKGKSLVIEDLDFKITKSRSKKGQGSKGRKYNEMMHSFAYKQFVNLVEGIAFRHRVEVVRVNPAYTSYLAKKFYCDRMKLSSHVGAAYVIARKGSGLKVG